MAEIKASQIRDIKNIDQWAEQICYWRTHQDVFIEEYFKIKLKDVQKIQAFIADYDSTNSFNCHVHNAEAVALKK